MPSLREIGEVELIRRLARARGAPAGDGVVVDSGDDAAVLRPGHGMDLVLTTDAFVEGRHFLAAWSPPRAAGERLARANLSDLAAMAAVPRWALLSMGVRPDGDLDALLELQAGVNAALALEGARLVGGNLAAVDGAEWFSFTLAGEAPHGRAWTRAGARPGDLVAVTGHPGRAGAGLALARALGPAAGTDAWRPLVEAWLAPGARVALALALREAHAVRAAIDLSDGFAGDLARLCEAGGVGAEVEAASWPPDPLLARASAALGVTHDALRFGPSDDYELLLAVEPGARGRAEGAAYAAGVPIAFVGCITEAPGVVTLRAEGGGLQPLAGEGFDHFGGSA